ncbi:MAG: ABC-F type ribosomal protection protein, partial [Firmicutes bacterium]|nr:ABC-F type ribosomal protection protein [Bacillota bacterium]
MILLNGSGLEKVFSGETLFDNVSFSVDSADKIGFVGVNGAGKSTLFKILTGEIESDGGEVFKNKDVKIGCLDQYALMGSRRTIWQEMLTVFDDVTAMENELEDIRRDIERKNGDLERLVARQTELQDKFSESGGFYYKSKIRGALLGLGFSEDDFDLDVSKLSGGQKTRVELGKLLLSDANLLLLDEPTNHLDIKSVEWLEEFLKGYNGAFIVISHDRYFLDRVTNKTFEMRRGKLRVYNGNYTKYTELAEVERKTEERSYENTMREIKRLEAVVEQQRRWNREKNIKTAESKMKVIDRLEKELTAPDAKNEEMDFRFKAIAGGGQEVLVTEGLSKAFDGEPLFKNADVFIKKGERVFLTGANGCGKTTFLKIVTGQYEPSAGTCKVGANIEIGYYDQLQENLNMNNTVLDELYDEYPNMTITELRNALAVFLFRGEDVFKSISSLSGGERARVELAKLMLKKNNFLIMDEPTNHLDIESREALERALDGYDGTMLMVSHDRYFINKLADRILYMTPDGIESHIGNYDDYAAASAVTVEPKKKPSENKLSYQEKKRAEAQKRKVLNRFNKVEQEIAELEDAVKAKESELEAPEVAT